MLYIILRIKHTYLAVKIRNQEAVAIYLMLSHFTFYQVEEKNEQELGHHENTFTKIQAG